jgi:hypothetical protein
MQANNIDRKATNLTVNFQVFLIIRHIKTHPCPVCDFSVHSRSRKMAIRFSAFSRLIVAFNVSILEL